MYQLYIANKNYSSWSLRPWVLMKTMGIEFEERLRMFESENNFSAFRSFSPSGTVPCLVDESLVDQGLVDESLVDQNAGGETVVWDSLAIVEYLAERHSGIWPDDPVMRAFARCISAEMHSSFSHLRTICPMNCAIKVKMKGFPAGLAKDISRIDEIWQEGLSRFGGEFLTGDRFSAADAFYAPVVYRVVSYQLPVSKAALDYCQRILSLPAMLEWDAAAIAEPHREVAHEEEARAAGEIILDRRD